MGLGSEGDKEMCVLDRHSGVKGLVTVRYPYPFLRMTCKSH